MSELKEQKKSAEEHGDGTGTVLIAIVIIALVPTYGVAACFYDAGMQAAAAAQNCTYCAGQ